MENKEKDLEENKKPKKKAPKKSTELETQETVEVTKTLSEISEVEIVESIKTVDNDEQPEVKVVQSEEKLSDIDKIDEIKEEPVPVIDEQNMLVVEQVELKLSKQAQGWADWLRYQKISPEKFLERFPNHKFKSFIEEIIAFEAEK